MDERAMPVRQIPDRDEAIATLFYACYPKLVRTGYSLAGDWAVAEEMAQEAFVRLWHKWRWIRDPETAPAYLYRTVVNLGNAAIRRRALERRVARFRTEQPEGPDPVADLDPRFAIAALTPSRVYPGGSCSQYCSQVYAIAGAVWEPTAQQIIRIDPAAMPG
jgi:DNA-directed RNA polymerase specialized sigma24 family protein